MIIIPALVGILINFVGINPIRALVWTAVLNGLVAPPILAVIMLVANNRQIMGAHTNGHWTNIDGSKCAIVPAAWCSRMWQCVDDVVVVHSTSASARGFVSLPE
jgi:Mn2+/Fe2+ NRAMP family transporter